MQTAKTDQTGRMPRLICVYAGRTLILLVLSCRDSNAVYNPLCSISITARLPSQSKPETNEPKGLGELKNGTIPSSFFRLGKKINAVLNQTI